MKLFSFTEKFLPYCLPALLIFSRSLADIVVISVVILFLAKCFIEKDFSWLHDSWIKAFIVFLAFLVFINSPLSLNPLDSIFYSIAWVRWPLFAIALSCWIFIKDDSFNKLFFAIIITFIFFISDLLYQFFINETGIFGLSTPIHINRLTVPFSNNVIPGRFLYIFTFIFLSIYFFRQFKFQKKINYLFCFSILTFGFLFIFITGERMSFLIYSSSVLILILGLMFLDNKNIIKTSIFILFCLSVVLLGYFFESDIYHRTIISSYEKIIYLFDSDYWQVFTISFEKFKNNIFIGSGLHQFKMAEPNNISIMHAHNLPLNLMVETGLIGLLLFYNTIFYIFKDITNKLQKENHFLLLLVVVLLYICFFPLHTNFSLSHNWINANVWFVVGMILALANLTKNRS